MCTLKYLYQNRFFSSLTSLLHVINIAGVGHLLNVDACLFLGASDSSDNSLFNHILQVGKPTPDVPKVLKGVCPGARVPIAAKQSENQKPHGDILRTCYQNGIFKNN